MTGFDTRAIRAGGVADPLTGAVVPPIHLSTTFRQEFPGELLAGFKYGRCANPTRSALQENLAALEGGIAAYSFASGMAAEDAFFRAIIRPGDHIVLGLDAYGGSYRMIDSVYGSMGVTRTHIFTLAPSLGGVESLIEWPSGMTHTSVEGTALAVPHNLVRIAVGIETEKDLIDDLTQALDSL